MRHVGVNLDGPRGGERRDTVWFIGRSTHGASPTFHCVASVSAPGNRQGARHRAGVLVNVGLTIAVNDVLSRAT